MGKSPSVDHEPTMEQLSAVNELILSDSVPYVDFSIFGPYNRRFLKRTSVTSHKFNPATGEWKKADLPGPASYEDWLRCWMVFRTALLILDILPVEPLVASAELIRDFLVDRKSVV